MKCLKSFFFGFFLFFILSFFLVFSATIDTYATSVTCEKLFGDGYLSDFTTSIPLCDTSSLDSSTLWFYNYEISYRYDTTPGGSFPVSLGIFLYSYDIYRFPVFLASPGVYFGSFSDSSYGSGSRFRHYTTLLRPNSPASSSFDPYIEYFNLTISDTFSDCPSSPSGSISILENGTYNVSEYAEAVVDVPAEVIQGDYHDDLLKIYHAIIICAAVCLVLYFFYCIYRMIIKNTGGK